MSLSRLQNSYTASQRTNQELEDKLHTLVTCPRGSFGWHYAHSVAGGQDSPVKCHSALGFGRDGSGRAVGREPQCAMQVGTVLMLTLFLFSPRLPLMLPPLLLHSPLRPLLATAGFLQLRLSLCVFSLALAFSAKFWDWGVPGYFFLCLECTHPLPLPV